MLCIYGVKSMAKKFLSGTVLGISTALVLFGADSAQAGVTATTTTITSGCVRSSSSFTCVSSIQRAAARKGIAMTEEEKAEAADRDRRWFERCKPYLRQDDQGVDRYYYAAKGCEFGKFQD